MIPDEAYLRPAAELTKRTLQEMLGSTLHEAPDPAADLTPAERAKYVSDIATVFPVLEREIKYFIGKKVLEVAMLSESMPQLMFGRGEINMGDILLDRFKTLKSEHEENIQHGRQPEPTNQPIPTI